MVAPIRALARIPSGITGCRAPKEDFGKERTGLVFVLASLAAWFQSAKAVTVTWDNGVVGSWNEATNWDTGNVPGMNNDLVIPNMGEFVVTRSSGTTNVNSLDPSNGLTISEGTFSVVSTSNISAAATLTLFIGTTGGVGPLTMNRTFEWGRGRKYRFIGSWRGNHYRDHDLETTWDNNGTVNWTDGDFDFQGSGAMFNNNGLFQIITTDPNDVIKANAPGNTATFNNSVTDSVIKAFERTIT